MQVSLRINAAPFSRFSISILDNGYVCLFEPKIRKFVTKYVVYVIISALRVKFEKLRNKNRPGIKILSSMHTLPKILL